MIELNKEQLEKTNGGIIFIACLVTTVVVEAMIVATVAGVATQAVEGFQDGYNKYSS